MANDKMLYQTMLEQVDAFDCKYTRKDKAVLTLTQNLLSYTESGSAIMTDEEDELEKEYEIDLNIVWKRDLVAGCEFKYENSDNTYRLHIAMFGRKDEIIIVFENKDEMVEVYKNVYNWIFNSTYRMLAN